MFSLDFVKRIQYGHNFDLEFSMVSLDLDHWKAGQGKEDKEKNGKQRS